MLKVIQHEQQGFFTQVVAQRFFQIDDSQGAQPECIGDRRDHALG
jgi:hypothetical protein